MIAASITAIHMTTRTADRAPSGLPPPNSFATLVLLVGQYKQI